MLIRFLAIIVVGVLAETLAFTYVHRDVLALTTDWPVADRSASAFQARADRVLQKPKVTRAQVEAIATQARNFSLPAVEARALGQYGSKHPADRALRLRQADALHRAGDLQQAKRVYLDLLTDTSAGGR